MENPTQPTDGTTQKQIPGTTRNGRPDFAQIKKGESSYLKLSSLAAGQHVMTFTAQRMESREWTNEKTQQKESTDYLVLMTEAPMLFQGQKEVSVKWELEAGPKSLLYQLKEIAIQRPSQDLIGVQIGLKVDKEGGKNKYTVFWLNQGK